MNAANCRRVLAMSSYRGEGRGATWNVNVRVRRAAARPFAQRERVAVGYRRRDTLNPVETAASGSAAPSRKLDPRQLIKITVYGLLLVNFGHYFINDVSVAGHTAHAGWKWHDWTAAFATTIDETAWFLLLLLLELETYLLSDEAFTPMRVRAMQFVRVLCILFIGHTVFAYGSYLLELRQTLELAETTLCDLAGRGLSFARNLDYVEITAGSCTAIKGALPLYLFDQEQLVTDAAGLRVEWELAWVDLLEVLCWLVILFCLEVMVRLQEKGVTGGAALNAARFGKGVLYGFLWLIASYWAYRGHWVFAWDEALWILGFIAIGMNLSAWRDEIEEEAGGRTRSEGPA